MGTRFYQCFKGCWKTFADQTSVAFFSFLFFVVIQRRLVAYRVKWLDNLLGRKSLLKGNSLICSTARVSTYHVSPRTFKRRRKKKVLQLKETAVRQTRSGTMFYKGYTFSVGRPEGLNRCLMGSIVHEQKISPAVRLKLKLGTFIKVS